MPRYFVHLSHTNAPSNSLQRAVADYLKEKLDGTIVANGYASVFYEDLKVDISLLNERFPKCTPLTPSMWPMGRGWGVGLGAHFTVGLFLYEIKEDRSSWSHSSQISDLRSEIPAGGAAHA